MLALHATYNKLRLISKEISLYRYIPAAREAKAHLDNVIDLCGTPPKGVPLGFNQEIQQKCSLQDNFCRYRTSEPAGVHRVDEAEVRLRAEGEEALLEAHVRQLHRAVLLPHLLRNLPQRGGSKRYISA